ncbi:MAG: hypothetical protein MJZ63_06970, partial [Muribaculaceae bacterium]|nr:hypothetical protein [Muribaculaceae bacterium]
FLVVIKNKVAARVNASSDSYEKSTPKGCDETPINTGFEGTHTFVILRYPQIHLTVEARHWQLWVAYSGFHIV